MYSANINKRLRRYINPPTVRCLSQKQEEFDPPPSLAMIYPTALRHFAANAFSCISPLYSYPSGGGGGGNKHQRRQEKGDRTPLPSASSKTRRPDKSSAPSTVARRTSPRTNNANIYATQAQQIIALFFFSATAKERWKKPIC
jgi:hypothetical protein